MILTQLLHDETGFIVSAELVLVATILVIGLIVGLSEVQHAVVQELNDVAMPLAQSTSRSSIPGSPAGNGADGVASKP